MNTIYNEIGILSKCYQSYFLECLLKRKKIFFITFNGKYIKSFPKRLQEWCIYILDNIYRFYLLHITPKDDSTLKKYQLIHYNVSKPIHMKVSNCPDEQQLYLTLSKMGIKIIDENIQSTYTIYEVRKL